MVGRLARALVIAGVITVAIAARGRGLTCIHDDDCTHGFGAPCDIPPCVNGQCTMRVCPGDACHPQHCDGNAGCVVDPLRCPSNGLVCDGEESCEVVGGVAKCRNTGPLNCNDGDACTLDSPCTEPFGCTHTPRNCDDGDPCTIDSCNHNSGCIHELIPQCCRLSADCPDDKCTVDRVCRAPFCSEGTPRNCDDGEDCTFDYCDPQTGCVHTPIDGCAHLHLMCQTDADCASPCATDRICSGGACTGTPVVCDDGDACTVDSCDPATGCVGAPRTGFDALACVCERAEPPSCAGQSIPKSVAKKQTRGCKAVGLAATASGGKRTRLIGKAAKQFQQAAKQATKAAGHGISAECGGALAVRFSDDRSRAVTARDQP
jgi:hypothetical protein